jgi:hypothetical protein
MVKHKRATYGQLESNTRSSRPRAPSLAQE